MRTYLEELSSWSDIQELFDIDKEEPLMVYATKEDNNGEDNTSYVEIVISLFHHSHFHSYYLLVISKKQTI